MAREQKYKFRKPCIRCLATAEALWRTRLFGVQTNGDGGRRSGGWHPGLVLFAAEESGGRLKRDDWLQMWVINSGGAC